MFSFRQKIFITYIVVFLFFLAGMYPFASSTVRDIVRKGLCDRSKELIEKIQDAPNNEALVRRLKEQKGLVFFRISVITDEMKVLYDSHLKRPVGPRFSQEQLIYHPEILQAAGNQIGYHEDYSQYFGQKFAYLAKPFDFHGKQYILRTAFPQKYVEEMTSDFELGVLTLATAVLLLFSVLTWFIINQLTSPIEEITRAINPYQDGAQTAIPEIKLRSMVTSEEFEKLALTLNSLTSKIQKHIDQLTTETQEKEAILESLVEGVIAIDSSMTITYANHMALKFLDLKSEELIGQSLTQLGHYKAYNLLMSCQQDQQICHDTMTIQKDDRKIFLDIVASPKKHRKGAILVLQDKTPHYKLLEMRKDFIANASHELKTPITIIQGFAETLHDNPDLPQETLFIVTDKILRNCKRMTNLIKDLLALSDVENLPPSRLTECDLNEIIENCCSTLKDKFPSAEMHLINLCTSPPLVKGDPNLLELAFLNLIDNAAKYSHPPAKITVELSCSTESIKIKVTDQGIGIPPQDLEHIFDRFYTVDKAHSQKLGGSGLGLSLVQTIISKHFGKITVQSKIDQGSVFTITLPIYNDNISKI